MKLSKTFETINQKRDRLFSNDKLSEWIEFTDLSEEDNAFRCKVLKRASPTERSRMDGALTTGILHIPREIPLRMFCKWYGYAYTIKNLKHIYMKYSYDELYSFETLFVKRIAHYYCNVYGIDDVTKGCCFSSNHVTMRVHDDDIVVFLYDRDP